MLRNTVENVAELPDSVSENSCPADQESVEAAGFGTCDDLDQYIRKAEEELTESPASHPDRTRRLSNLSCNLSMRLQSLGNTADLDQAILHSEYAVAMVPGAPDDPDRATMLTNLSAYYGLRFEKLGVQSDIEHAGERGEQGVAESKTLDSDQPLSLSHQVIVIIQDLSR